MGTHKKCQRGLRATSNATLSGFIYFIILHILNIFMVRVQWQRLTSGTITCILVVIQYSSLFKFICQILTEKQMVDLEAARTFVDSIQSKPSVACNNKLSQGVRKYLNFLTNF